MQIKETDCKIVNLINCLICKASEWTGFHMIMISVMKELNDIHTQRNTGIARTPTNIQDGNLCSNSKLLKVVDCCFKTLHLRCSLGF